MTIHKGPPDGGPQPPVITNGNPHPPDPIDANESGRAKNGEELD